MPYVDRKLKCVDCGSEFDFTAAQQERFAELGFTNEPKRCGPCRAARKALDVGSGTRPKTGSCGKREFFTTKCATCGGEARVPFRPRGDRPVYCSKCFSERR